MKVYFYRLSLLIKSEGAKVCLEVVLKFDCLLEIASYYLNIEIEKKVCYAASSRGTEKESIARSKIWQ